MLARHYYHGHGCFEQDHAKAIDLFNRSANLGFSKAHSHLGYLYREAGDLKKAKFHCEAAALAGHEEARCNLGVMDANSGNIERAMKHWKIAASAGHYDAMLYLRLSFEEGHVSRESIDSTLTAYYMSCAEMRSEARDAR
jgi:TPR repeat protein